MSCAKNLNVSLIIASKIMYYVVLFFDLYKINVVEYYLIKVFLKKFCSSSLYFQCYVLMFNLFKNINEFIIILSHHLL
jgi:hypothetical protein